MEEVLLRLLRQLLLFGALLTPLELLLPAWRRGLWRPGVGLDLALTVVNTLTVAVAGGGLLAVLSLALGAVVPEALPAALAAQPAALQFAEILVLSELFGYAAHRLSHRVPALWRLHRLHHSSAQLDWIAAHRQHPLEVLWLLGATNLPLLALGYDAAPLAGVILLQKLHTAAVHANLRLPAGRWERWVAGPRFHHWHHSADDDRHNFAALLPILDVLFGTWRLPPGHPSSTGIAHPDVREATRAA